MNKSTHLFILISCFIISIGTFASNRQKVLSINKLDEARAEMWKEWCSSLEKIDTLPRLDMCSLGIGEVVKWRIPQELEPFATMKFYSGVKGELPDNGYPAFLYLHGSGPKAQEWATGLRLAKQFDDAPSFYMIPQIPNEGEYYRWWQKGKQWVWNRLIRQLLVNPNIDPTRIYLYGISEGGYGSQRLASYYADYLAGAGPMAGGEPLRNAPAENLSRTAFSLVTGELDGTFYRNILTQRTKNRLDSLKSQYPEEFIYRVMLEPNKGHHINYDVTTVWLKNYKRNAQPNHFRWENFEMDGIKRNAFYNLEVLEEPSDDRYDYEFSVADNIVKVNVNKVSYIITEKDPQFGIELDNTRLYEKSIHGSIRIYLCESLVDFSKPVTVYLNGKMMFADYVSLSSDNLKNSILLFGDPLRIFPASVDLTW